MIPGDFEYFGKWSANESKAKLFIVCCNWLAV